ncbi:MAG TPA: biopolymer transporter ExbD [Polyangia bacterium]|jgi:biopolymer transport protein ExbD|nr:biopolymer transporter ExbD [Polyangia bacterium]
MAMTGGSSRGVKNDINVTPLVDVVLVLLIIFMVVTPMLQRGKDVHLPKANKLTKEEKNGDPLVVSVTADHKLWVESVGFQEDALETKLAAELSKEPNRRVLLKGDQSVTVGDVRKVMDHAKKAGARAVELAIEEIKK